MYLQYPCQLCRKAEGKLNVFGYFGCKGCANKIKTKEQADDVFNEMETIGRLTAEKEMLRTALEEVVNQYERVRSAEGYPSAQSDSTRKAKQALALTAPSKESDIERDLRTAGQG